MSELITDERIKQLVASVGTPTHGTPEFKVGWRERAMVWAGWREASREIEVAEQRAIDAEALRDRVIKEYEKGQRALGNMVRAEHDRTLSDAGYAKVQEAWMERMDLVTDLEGALHREEVLEAKVKQLEALVETLRAEKT